MKTALLLSSFPVLSETFILNQIIGLLDRKVEVDIYASPSHAGHPSSDVDRLVGRTFYRFDDAANRLRRIAAGSRELLVNRERRELLPALNWPRYGLDALSLRLLFVTRQLSQGPDYDIVHCHFGPMGLLGVKVKDVLKLRAKVVTTFYGYDLSRYLRQKGKFAYRHLFERGDLFLAICETFRERLISLGCPEESILVHHIGVDARSFPIRIRQPTDGSTRILSVARLTQKKGIEYALRAIALAARRGYRIRYRVIGDGPERPSLQRLIRDLQLSSCVELVGWMSEEQVRRMLYDSDILLAPSVTATDGDTEGTPVAIMEAMATGMPVISTRHGGIPEIINDGESGLLADERDADALAERLAFLIDSPWVWEPMGQAARTVVEERFDSERLNDRLVDIYHALL